MLGPMAAQIVRFSPAGWIVTAVHCHLLHPLPLHLHLHLHLHHLSLGDLLAVSSPDGRLALWSRAELPSHHLEAAPTCLAWAPPRTATPRKKKKDRKKDEESRGEVSPDLVALGTRSTNRIKSDFGKSQI